MASNYNERAGPAFGATSPVDLRSDPIDASAISDTPVIYTVALSHETTPNVGQRRISPALLTNHPAAEDTIFIADTSKANLINNSVDADADEDAEAVNANSQQLVEDHGDYHDGAHDHPTTSLTRTFINFMKGNIGTGILAMPDAIKNAGLYVGTISLLLLGFLSTYCCHQLLHAYLQVSGGKPISYARVAELTFKKAKNKTLKKFAKPARHIINGFLILTQMGYCCVYILFCSKMIKEVVDSNVLSGSPSIQVYETILLAFLIPYCFVTTLKALSIFTLFANLVTVATLVIVLQYVFRNLQPVEDVDWYPTDLATVPLFFGTAMFAFESIGLILPIENRMKDRMEFHGWNGLLSFCMVCIMCLYATVGFYGYLAFGADARMILSNLPKDEWLYSSVKLMYASSIFISFNLQLYVPIQIMYPAIKTWVNRPWFDRYGEYIFRAFMVVLSYGLAVGIPCLEYMISLFGALASSGLALIFPPIIEIVCCFHKGHRHRLTPWLIIKNVVISSIGIFGCAVGTFVAIQSIVQALSQPGGCPV